MQKVYLDNAATTPIDPAVVDVMIPLMREQFGNPSSIHSYGRQAKTVIENARKSIAKLLNVTPSEIFFTSGGTEANNMAIRCTVNDHQLAHAITSPIEHHAVLHTLECLEKEGKIKLSYVKLKAGGEIDLLHLESLLNQNDRSFVSLMHANNELGNLLSLKDVSELCVKYDAIFHCDMVQTMGHYAINLQDIRIHLASCAAHKFHGLKGVGFIYINHALKITPFIHGGSQERNMRGGTENIYGIAGIAKAFEIAHHDMPKHQEHVMGLKHYMMDQLKKNIPGVEFNGADPEKGLYTVLNVCFPETENAEMLLFNLDIAGIAASGGSACSSGSNQGSHVLKAIGCDIKRPSIRFSFSKYNTKEEIDYCVSKLKELFAIPAC